MLNVDITLFSLKFSSIVKNDDDHVSIFSSFVKCNKFWTLAKQHPIKLSKPLKSYKGEIIRIENFQKNLDNLNFNRWTNKDFYDYWSCQNKWYSLYR